MTKLNARFTALRNRGTDVNPESGVALLSAVFFMILVAGLSIVLLSAILAQATPAFTAQKNTRTVYAAQAGLQSTLGIMRTATAAPDNKGNIFGDVSKLPCTVAGRVNADVDGTSYQVAVSYFVEDPTSSDDAWRQANKIACTNGSGPVTPPLYAYIRSGGLGAAIPGNADATSGDRYLAAIYKFKVSNVNIEGGMVFNADKKVCLEAVTATAGSKILFVKAQTCVGNDRQLWIYATDYTVKLASSVAAGAPLCITGPVVDGQGTQDALLQPCKAPTDAARWNQLWSWTGDYSWRGQRQDISDYSNYCLSPDAANGSDLTTKFLKVRNGCYGTFAPSAAVGAGAASYWTHQIVNYKEFGRCADVTNEQVGYPFMIVYPCKQDPTGTGTKLKWNHKWYYFEPDPGQTTRTQTVTIQYNNDPGQTSCFTAPAAGSGSTDTYFVGCNASAQQQWTRVGKTGDYASSYLFVDFLGRCLTADRTSLFNGDYAKMRVNTCNGALDQKWNAPPTYVDASFGGYREVAG